MLICPFIEDQIGTVVTEYTSNQFNRRAVARAGDKTDLV